MQKGGLALNVLIRGGLMVCKLCKCPLDSRYVRYRDIEGNPYCQQCYLVIGGVV